MKTFVALGLAATALAQSGPPSGCSASSPNSFQITTVNISSSSTKRDLDRRQLSGILTLSLNNGDLKDQAGRIGYIASNYQFQFDNPVQAGARESTGFSLCSNGSLALGGTTVWYSCLSGDFYNLYSQSTGAQCIPIHIQATNAGGSSPSDGASQIPDGQPQASSPGAPAVTQIPDGQPQASQPGAPITQISDGQPQASAPGAPVTQISDGQPQASQPAAPPAPPVSQIPDGQPQASQPGAPITQISDGQPQASAPGAPVTQISDGQPQAPTPAGPAVTQISDGQPQASSPGLPIAPVQSGNFSGTAPPLATFTGAANAHGASFGGVVAGILGLLALF